MKELTTFFNKNKKYILYILIAIIILIIVTRAFKKVPKFRDVNSQQWSPEPYYDTYKEVSMSTFSTWDKFIAELLPLNCSQFAQVHNYINNRERINVYSKIVNSYNWFSDLIDDYKTKAKTCNVGS